MIRPHLFWFKRDRTGSKLCILSLTDAPRDELTHLYPGDNKLTHLCQEDWLFNGFTRICESEARRHLAACL